MLHRDNIYGTMSLLQKLYKLHSVQRQVSIMLLIDSKQLLSRLRLYSHKYTIDSIYYL